MQCLVLNYTNIMFQPHLISVCVNHTLGQDLHWLWLEVLLCPKVASTVMPEAFILHTVTWSLGLLSLSNL